MDFTNEMIAKARTAASAEELRTMAKEKGLSLTEEEAGQYFAFLHTSGAMSDEELEAVSGGKGSNKRSPKYKEGQYLWVGYASTQNYLHVIVRSTDLYDDQRGWRYVVDVLNEKHAYTLFLWLDSMEHVYTRHPE